MEISHELLSECMEQRVDVPVRHVAKEIFEGPGTFPRSSSLSAQGNSQRRRSVRSSLTFPSSEFPSSSGGRPRTDSAADQIREDHGDAACAKPQMVE